MAEKKQRQIVSLKLNSQLSRLVKEAAEAEGRSWQGQAMWFLEVFDGFLERLDSRPIPQKIPKSLQQDAYAKLLLPSNLCHHLEVFSETEQVTLAELIRQLLEVGVETWQRTKPGIRKEVFRQLIIKK